MTPEPTATMRKFGHPETLVADFRWWAALYRRKQATLGSLVLAAKCDVKAFSALPAEAFADLAEAVRATEAALARFARYERINYLMLMMVDPEPHFHVFPRYEGARRFGGEALEDKGWPGPPALDSARDLGDAFEREAVAALKTAFEEARRA